VFTLLLLVVFSAGVVWAFTERDFVEKDTFDLHVTSEEKFIEEKFDAQEKLIDQKFKNTDQKIEHVNGHLEEQKQTLEDIKELLRD
jgi:hypothetical protein